MKHLFSYFSIKILFSFVFFIVFNNHKISANNLHVNFSSNTDSFSLNNLTDNYLNTYHLEKTNIVDVEEEFNSYFDKIQIKALIVRKAIGDNLHFNVYSFSIEKKRYYILYCQLKTYYLTF